MNYMQGQNCQSHSNRKRSRCRCRHQNRVLTSIGVWLVFAVSGVGQTHTSPVGLRPQPVRYSLFSTFGAQTLRGVPGFLVDPKPFKPETETKSENFPSLRSAFLQHQIGMPGNSIECMPFFCRIEAKAALRLPFAIKFRLGDVPYVDYLEGKRIFYTP